MTRARSTRASWSAAAVVSPIVAAMAAGSILWATSHNPLATADEMAAVPATSSAQVVSSATSATPAKSPTLAQLRKEAKRLQRAVAQARKEARIARDTGVVTAASGSTWQQSVPSTSAGNSSGASAQPAPQSAPEPPPADTWTGSSGG